MLPLAVGVRSSLAGKLGPRPSSRFGLGPAVLSDARGVGSDEPRPFATVVRADVASTHHERPAGVARRLQIIGECVIAENSEPRRVLKRKPNRSDLVDETDGLPEEPGSLSVDSSSFGVGGRNILARRASNDDVGEISEVGHKSSCGEISDISIHPTFGMMDGEDSAPPRINLTSGNRAIACAGHAKRPATRPAAEKIEDPHGTASCSRNASRAASMSLCQSMSSDRSGGIT